MPDQPPARAHLEVVPLESFSQPAPSAPSGGWRDRVAELLDRVAAQRCLDFEPAPAAVTAALPQFIDHVENLASAMDGHDRRWLAAALAALADQVERTTLPDPGNVHGG